MDCVELRENFERWLAEHFTPARAASGDIRRRSGVVDYEDIDRLRMYLDGSWVGPAEQFRRGSDPTFHTREQIQQIVELWEPEKILALRRDQAVAQELTFGLSMHQSTGHAPDGGALADWARRCVERHSQRLGVRAELGGRAMVLWREIFPAASANERRRQLLLRRAS